MKYLVEFEDIGLPLHKKSWKSELPDVKISTIKREIKNHGINLSKLDFDIEDGVGIIFRNYEMVVGMFYYSTIE